GEAGLRTGRSRSDRQASAEARGGEVGGSPQWRRPEVRPHDMGAQGAGRSPRLARQPRNPLEVLARFDRHIEGDLVEGDTLSTFVEVVGQRLRRSAPPPPASPDKHARIYVYHSAEDEAYAFDVAKTLSARNVSTRLPSYEGPAAQLIELHRRY